MAVVCVDAGTTMVKAVLFDGAGRELGVVRQPTPVRRDATGASEQDMDAVWEAVVTAVRAVRQPHPEPVDLLAFTGQGDGCWLVDAAGEPTGPAILWNDARPGTVLERWDDAGVLTAAFRINGTLGFPGTSGAILRWLHDHQPDRLRASARALSCDGWLFSRFTGVLAVDESDAANPFLDVRTRAYSPELLELFGMPWVERLLPPVRDDRHRVEPLRRQAAEQLGLPAGVPVVMAPFDIPATAIGMGAITPGDACTVLGTTLSTEVVLAEPDTSGEPAGMLLPSGVERTYVRSLAAMAGVEVIGWGMRLLGLDQPNWLSDLASSAAPGSGGLVFHPYLSPAGERAPFRDSAARGGLIGLSSTHTRAQVARAILEGTCCAVRDCLEFTRVRPAELRLCGGGAASRFWCQLLADVTGVPTSRSADAEVGAKGALISGLVATGRVGDPAGAGARLVRPQESFSPDPAAVARYQELFADFLATREALAPQWPRLGTASE